MNVTLISSLRNVISLNMTSICYATILFFATLFFSNEYYYLLLPIAVVLFNIKELSYERRTILQSKKVRSYILITFIYLAISYANKLMNGHPITSLKDCYASFLLFPLLLFTASHLELKKVFKYFLFWVALECLISFSEYSFGVRSFFIENIAEFNNSSDYLYDHRVNGLSISSSVFALKLLIALISIEFVQLNNWFKLFLKVILFSGIILSFNRAVILSIIFFWCLLFCHQIFKKWKFEFKNIVSNGINIIMFTAVFLVFANHNILIELKRKNPEKRQLELKNNSKNPKLTFSDFNETQATIHFPKMKAGVDLDTTTKLNTLIYKSSQGINTSGRILIWMNFIEFIGENKWFGFGSDKLLFKAIDQNNKTLKLIHAHNSFIQLLASNGIWITFLFFAILFFIWTKKNILFLIPILVYSCFQYGIFWGFSILDVFFFSILMINTNLLNEK